MSKTLTTLVNDPFENDPNRVLEWAYGPAAATSFKQNIVLGDQRAGQAFMNTLRKFDQESYERLTGSLVDPFYDDKKIPAAIDKLTSK